MKNRNDVFDLKIMSVWSFNTVGEDPLIKDWTEKINEKTKKSS
jgi:hypothetical protein